MIKLLEVVLFRARIPVLVTLGIVTVVMGYFATHLRMDAGFFKQFPSEHEYIKTFFDYQDRLFGANRVIVVLRQKDGDIWNQQFLGTLKGISDDIFYLPGIDRRTVTSLWTPNTRVLEITEDGISARDVIPGRITPETMKGDAITQLRNDVIKGNLVGRLVSNDFTASLVVADLLEYDAKTGERLNYFDLGAKLEENIRHKYEQGDAPYEVHIIGFAKMISDIAAGGIESAPLFFGAAFILTVLALYLYCFSWKLTWLTVLCSATSVVWQFGLITVLGYGLDPLAILVPFLVFAIGTSHGVQQLNMITAELSHGTAPEEAARSSFRGLLIPGSLSLVTAVVGFAALYIVPIPQIQELAVTASIGTGLKIVSNLVMLPLIASYFTYADTYAALIKRVRDTRLAIIKQLGVFAVPAVAYPVSALFFGLFVFAVIESQNRHVGDLHPGAPELRPDARYNYDANIISAKFSIGLDLLTVVTETPPQACVNYQHMNYVNEFSYYMQNQDGVRSVVSAAFTAKQVNAGWNEGNLKFRALPRNSDALSQSIGPIPTSSGLLDYDCTMLPVQVFTTDAKATTLISVVSAVKTWRAQRGIVPVLGQKDDKLLGLGDSTPDICWIERDQRDGSWVLTPSDLSGLVFTPPDWAKASYTLTVTGLKAPSAPSDINNVIAELIGLKGPHCPVDRPQRSVQSPYKTAPELFSFTLPVTVGKAGEPQALDILGAIKEKGFKLEEDTKIHVEGLPYSFHIRLASGGGGVTAAVNETIHVS
ncbi:MAG: RND family transporter [Alphaproteobacteria bacterium]|nr:RND family transporter [Alphaproteobacteria bacterium]